MPSTINYSSFRIKKATQQISCNSSRESSLPKPPLWVVDIIGPFGLSPVKLNHHFTGNPAGDTATIELDGIPVQVIGGYGIQRATLKDFSHPPLLWANLPLTTNLPLRYLAHLVIKMGCVPQGIASILYMPKQKLYDPRLSSVKIVIR